MSSSDHLFRTGLPAPRRSVGASGLVAPTIGPSPFGGPPAPGTTGRVTPAAFAIAPAGQPSGVVRPMVFRPFVAPGEETPAPEPEPAVAEIVELVPAEEPPPPPDLAALEAAAWREGLQKGYDEGLRVAAEEQQQLADRLAALLLGVVAETEGFVRGLEDDVVELALAVAEKVIAREVRLDRAVVVDVTRAALAEVVDATELRIRVNPDDLPLLEPRWQEMLPRGTVQQSELCADDLVERGGVVVETKIGYVDGQLKTRLNQVVNTFQAVLDGEPV